MLHCSLGVTLIEEVKDHHLLGEDHVSYTHQCLLPHVLCEGFTIVTNNEFKLSFYDRIVGSYVCHSKTDISWNHGSDLVEVGGSSVATLKVSIKK